MIPPKDQDLAAKERRIAAELAGRNRPDAYYDEKYPHLGIPEDEIDTTKETER